MFVNGKEWTLVPMALEYPADNEALMAGTAPFRRETRIPAEDLNRLWLEGMNASIKVMPKLPAFEAAADAPPLDVGAVKLVLSSLVTLVDRLQSNVRDGAMLQSIVNQGSTGAAYEKARAALAAIGAYEPPATPAPKVAVIIRNGVVQNVIANRPVQVALVDFDVNRETDQSSLRDIPSSTGGQPAQAHIFGTSAEVDSQECDELFDLAEWPQPSAQDVASRPPTS